jgi:hypothetical protein
MLRACSIYEENACKTFVGKPCGKMSLGWSEVDGRIVLKWIIGKEHVKTWTAFCDDNDEHLDFHNEDCFEQLNIPQLPWEDPSWKSQFCE